MSQFSIRWKITRGSDYTFRPLKLIYQNKVYVGIELFRESSSVIYYKMKLMESNSGVSTAIKYGKDQLTPVSDPLTEFICKCTWILDPPKIPSWESSWDNHQTLYLGGNWTSPLPPSLDFDGSYIGIVGFDLDIIEGNPSLDSYQFSDHYHGYPLYGSNIDASYGIRILFKGNQYINQIDPNSQDVFLTSKPVELFSDSIKIHIV